MQSLKIVTVGKMKNRDLANLCADYLARLSKFCKTELIEVKDSDPKREGEKILAALENFRGKIYAGGEEGKLRSSKAFAEVLQADLAQGGSAFIIGGAYGLSAEVKARAHEVFALSPMTFTHEFARLILLEQLYRAKNISANTGYHH